MWWGYLPALWSLFTCLCLCAILTTNAQAQALPAGDDSPRPRIFIYDLPPRLASHRTSHAFHGDLLGMLIRESPYYEPMGERADYFFIPSGGRWVPKSLLRTDQITMIRSITYCTMNDFSYPG